MPFSTFTVHRSPFTGKSFGFTLTNKVGQGFTLIELLVVIATMVLVFVAGMANFRDSQKRQELSNAVLSFKTDLRFAQELALSGKKPTGCNVLNGYIVDSLANDRYKIVANCNSPAVNIDVVAEKNIKSKFPTVLLTAFSTDIFFNVLGRGVNTPADIVITMSNASGSQTVTVTKGGEIN